MSGPFQKIINEQIDTPLIKAKKAGIQSGEFNYIKVTEIDTKKLNVNKLTANSLILLTDNITIAGDERLRPGLQTIAIGYQAGRIDQQNYAVAIGTRAGQANQGSYSVAMGYQAGQTNQGTNCTAVGINAGADNQQENATAVGYLAGNTNQGANAVAVGLQSGQINQNERAVAMGPGAGYNNQGSYATAVGSLAGNKNQGASSVAVGNKAGYQNQGQNAIAIGNLAGQTNQPSNSIILNANGTELNCTNEGLYVQPVRELDGGGATYNLTWNSGTKEIYVNTAKTFVIDHPDDASKYLVHACLEGPEGGVYYRGSGKITNNSSTTVELPKYVTNLAKDLTVQLTPISNGECEKINKLSTSKVENNSFTVYGKNCEFYWLVMGSRCDVEVEPVKTESNVKGDGPYKWI